MIKLFKKPFIYAIIFSILLMSLNIYVLLKTFVITEVISVVDSEEIESDNNIEKTIGSNNTDSNENEENQLSTEDLNNDPIITENSYESNEISIHIDEIYKNDTYIYIADIQISSSEYLKTALANNSYGNNVTQITSEIASSNNAILAINGDYYGANKRGYVIKEGILYRNTKRGDTENDDLVIYEDGRFEIINEEEISAEQLLENGVINSFAFGPTLILDGKIMVSEDDEVSKSKTDNPRTAIGIIDDLHYIFLVSDGRTEESKGLSLYQLAEIMKEYDCDIAYNLDGGGSSTLYFNGEVINNPTTSGKTIKERAVSDIVYIGY